MDAWMAFVSIIAIVAIVLVGGGLVAFIGHMIIGALDNDKKETTKNEVINYSDFKQIEAPKAEEKVAKEEYDFEAINEAKAEEERKMLEQEKDIDVFKLEALEVNDEEDLDALEARLKAENDAETETNEEVKQEVVADEADEFDEDIDSLLDEISNDIIEEEKETIQTEPQAEMDSELQNYHIDDYLNTTEEVEETTAEEITEEIEEDDIAEDFLLDEEDDDDEGEEVELDLTEEPAEDKVEEPVEEKSEDEKTKEIEDLKAQLADLNKKLEEARSGKVEVVSINMTEEECVSRLEILEERLKNAKKEYKINMKEFKPLKKVMNDLEKFQTKLRRKDTIVAKKKVSLYGVNNYVDIDKEKAEKLANDLELLEGLRLSVSHCEEVINANKDRYPILERTNQILEDQIAHIEADIASTQATLQKIREQNGEGENK